MNIRSHESTIPRSRNTFEETDQPRIGGCTKNMGVATKCVAEVLLISTS